MTEHAEVPTPNRQHKNEQPARAFAPPPVLSEPVSKYSVRMDGILRIIGEGEIGDKARSLNRDAEGYRKAGLVVGERTVLAQSVLEDFLRFNGICGTLEEGNSVRGIGELILDTKSKFPPELENFLLRLPSEFPKIELSDEQKKIFSTRGFLFGLDYLSMDCYARTLADYEKEYGVKIDIGLDNQSLSKLFAQIEGYSLSMDGWSKREDEFSDGERVRRTVAINNKYLFSISGIENPDVQSIKSDSDPAVYITSIDLYERVDYSDIRVPVITRSSAVKDDEGTGAYKSDCCENDVPRLLASFKKVLASYYAPKAKDLRSKAETGEGFGIVLEPAVGCFIGVDSSYPIFTSLFSGVATFDKDGVQITADLGFGGVVGGGGETIDMDAMAQASGKFSLYVDIKTKQAETEGFSSKLIYHLSGKYMEEMKKTRAGDIRMGTVFPDKGETNLRYFGLSHRYVMDQTINIIGATDGFDFLQFEESLRNAAKQLGARRVEFAVGSDPQNCGAGPKAHIVQSSTIPAAKEGSFSTVAPKGEQICLVPDCLGETRFKFRTFVLTRANSSVEMLQQLDARMKEGYVAIVSQNLSSNDNDVHLANAKGVIGFGENECFGNTFFATGQMRHYDASKLIDHFPNFMKKTGRFFASSQPHPLKSSDLYDREMVNGLIVLSAQDGYHFEAIAAEQKGGLRIYLCKDEP